MNPIIILGAGISGLSAGYHLSQKGIASVILEQRSDYGGLCGNFKIGDFRFDRFVHFSFTNDDYVKKIFVESTSVIAHNPNPFNLYKKNWIKHPAQNNLYPLESDEKEKIIRDFKRRPKIEHIQIRNYEEWLITQYGNYFAEHFPMVYTRKYWMCQAKELETKWIGNRLYQPSIDEVILGCQVKETPVTYYAKEMRYPTHGGYKSFLKKLAQSQTIRYNHSVVEIDLEEKRVKIATGEYFYYQTLISSLPLTELIKIVKTVPEEVQTAGRKLKYTSGYLISVGLKSKNIPPYLWWYIYDEDILPARVYSPSLKSPDNAPEGCASIQMEIYCRENKYSEHELYNRSVKKIIECGLIRQEDILFTDIRFEPYANIIFDHQIYEARQIVKDYFKSQGIKLIGRFGEWDYFWSDQSLKSGMNVEI